MKLRTIALSIALSFATRAFATPASQQGFSIKAIGQHQTGIFDDGAAEIVAHDLINQRIFKVNANAASIDVLVISDPSQP